VWILIELIHSYQYNQKIHSLSTNMFFLHTRYWNSTCILKSVIIRIIIHAVMMIHAIRKQTVVLHCTHVCIYVYVYVYVCVCVYVCIYIYVYVYVYMRICTHTVMHGRVYACMYICMCVCAYMLMCICMFNLCMCVCNYIDTYIQDVQLWYIYIPSAVIFMCDFPRM